MDDAAAIVNTNLAFSRKAYPDEEPPPEDTAYLSVRAPWISVSLRQPAEHLHNQFNFHDNSGEGKEVVTYEMGRIAQAFLDNEDSI